MRVRLLGFVRVLREMFYVAMLGVVDMGSGAPRGAHGVLSIAAPQKARAYVDWRDLPSLLLYFR